MMCAAPGSPVRQIEMPLYSSWLAHAAAAAVAVDAADASDELTKLLFEYTTVGMVFSCFSSAEVMEIGRTMLLLSSVLDNHAN